LHRAALLVAASIKIKKTRHTLVRVPGLFVSAARKFGSLRVS